MEQTPKQNLEQKKVGEKSILERIRTKTTKKVMGVLAGLTLALNAEASISNLEKSFDNEPRKASGGKEIVASNPEEKASGLTSQYEGSFEKFIEIDFTNYFDSDEAGLEGDSRFEIEKEFEDFLKNLDSSNIEKVLQSDFVIYSSCDERPSNAFDSNLDLSLARSQAIQQVLSDVLASFDFSQTNLSAEQIANLQAKKFSFDYPSFDGAEPGVVPLEKEYEIFGESAKEMTKEELYALVRMTRFELRIPLDAELEPLPQQGTLLEAGVEAPQTSFETITTLLNTEGSNIVLFDKSGSMNDDIDGLLQALQNFDDVKVGTFSNHFDGIADISDKEDIERVMSGGASTHERALHSLQEFLLEFSKEQSVDGLNIVLITDEAIQDISLLQIEQIQKEISEHGIDVSFVLRGEKETVVSLQDIHDALLANPKYQKEIQSIEDTIASATEKRDNASNKDVKDMWSRTVSQFQGKLEAMKMKAFTLPISDFQNTNL